MSKLHSFNPTAVREMLTNDRILSFRFKLLIEKENKEEHEALINLFDQLIIDDPFRFSRYQKIISNLQKNNS